MSCPRASPWEEISHDGPSRALRRPPDRLRINGSTHYPKGVDWHQKIRPAPLYQLLDDAVAKYASRPCTNFLGKIVDLR